MKSSIHLFILGCLLKEQRNFLDIANELKNRNAGKRPKDDGARVYRNIISLHKRGYLEILGGRESKLREETEFSITEAGINYFKSLMYEASGDLDNFRFGFGAFIVNLGHLSKDEQKRLLRGFIRTIETRSEEIEMNDCPEKFQSQTYAGSSFADLHRDVIQLIRKWALILEMAIEDSEVSTAPVNKNFAGHIAIPNF
jgi:DNA-binding PadR family transcriptional regulator